MHSSHGPRENLHVSLIARSHSPGEIAHEGVYEQVNLATAQESLERISFAQQGIKGPVVAQRREKQ